jgi:hypothetical protein
MCPIRQRGHKLYPFIVLIDKEPQGRAKVKSFLLGRFGPVSILPVRNRTKRRIYPSDKNHWDIFAFSFGRHVTAALVVFD